MPFYKIRKDITTMDTDAIVNPANSTLVGTGGVSGQIYAKTGASLLDAVKRLAPVKTGDAVITPGFELPAKFIIHTVGPIFKDGMQGEEAALRACYRNTLRLAEENGLESVAFPVISSGIFGYPKDEAVAVATEEILRFLNAHDMTVYLVFYDESPLFRFNRRDISEYISSHFTGEFSNREEFSLREKRRDASYMMNEQACPAETDFAVLEPEPVRKKENATKLPKDAFGMVFSSAPKPSAKPKKAHRVEIDLTQDEAFVKTLFRLIDRVYGGKDTDCYKAANIDRKLFSKIRSNPDYKPKKNTVVAFCIALKLTLEEAQDLLGRAGYSLSTCTDFDLIIRYCLEHKIYNINDVNDILMDYDQVQLGA